MNRRVLILFSTIVSTVIILSAATYKRIKKKNLEGKVIQSIPSFNFQQLDGAPFATRNIDLNADSVIINYYNPDCEHCQYMAIQVRKNITQFNRVQFIMVTSADSLRVNEFQGKYQLNSLPNLKLLLDTHHQFDAVFGPTIAPSFFIYNYERRLVKKIVGETKIENLFSNQVTK